MVHRVVHEWWTCLPHLRNRGRSTRRRRDVCSAYVCMWMRDIWARCACWRRLGRGGSRLSLGREVRIERGELRVRSQNLAKRAPLLR